LTNKGIQTFLRGFSFNKELISQKISDILRKFSYFSKIQAKLAHFPLRKSSFSGIILYLGDFSLKKYLVFTNSDIFRGFSFSKAFIPQKLRHF
jgi:hypothetical protein